MIYGNASWIGRKVADEFAVMRIARLIEGRQLTGVVTRTLGKWTGKGGSHALIQGVSDLQLGRSPFVSVN